MENAQCPCIGLDPNIDDNRPTMVAVNDVTMMFNIASEQLNNLKEYVIAIARRELMFKEFLALQHISFEVKKGDVYGILGTNGSGKSTMMKIIAGVLDPTKGTCTVNGGIAPLIELGAGFDMDLTARENIYLNGALLGYNKKFIEQHFDDIVDFAEVKDFLDMPLKNYSSGMVARIAFAIATVIVPEILLVDEVLSVGDFMFQKKCENRIKELIEQHGVTVLIVSHSNDQIARLCNKAVWIEKGHMKLMGSAQEVCRVYGMLGGRTGSKESEEQLYERLIRISSCNLPVPTSYYAGGPTDLTISLAGILQERNGEADASGTAIVVSGSTFINYAFASQFANAYNASVYPANIEDLPMRTELALHEKKPERIIFIDCGESAVGALDAIKKLPWNPDICDLSGTGDPTEYSLNLFNHGAEKRLWGKTAVVIDFADELETFAMSPYLREQKAPILFSPQAGANTATTSFAHVVKTLKEYGIERLVCVGPSIAESDLAQFGENFKTATVARDSDSVIERLVDIAQFELDEIATEQPINIIVGSTDPSQRFYLSSSVNLPDQSGVELLVNTADMDDMMAAIRFLESNRQRINKPIFYGSETAFFTDDANLMLYSLEG